MSWPCSRPRLGGSALILLDLLDHSAWRQLPTSAADSGRYDTPSCQVPGAPEGGGRAAAAATAGVGALVLRGYVRGGLFSRGRRGSLGLFSAKVPVA